MSTRRRTRSALRLKTSIRRALAVESLESRLLMAADFGDAPAPYPTTLAENGARHEAVGGMLGASRDSEADGVHSASADADGADDSGVVFGALRVGQLGAEAVVTVQGVPIAARLDAWIDFNRDGSWSGPGERLTSLPLADGQVTIKFDVPATAMPGVTFARFRLSTLGSNTPEGAAADGEVEDYAVTISPAIGASGNFGSRQTIANNANGVTNVFAADVDSDGDMDFVSAAFSDNDVIWHENNGSETFVSHTIAANAAGVRGVYAVDLDRDGDVDILSAAEADNKISWYQNDGNQVFTPLTIASAAPGVKNIYVADVDSDGDLDVLSANGSRTAWHQNSGGQVFTQILLPATTTAVFGVFAADMDRDGDIDVLYSSAGTGDVGWYENNGAEVFTTRVLGDNIGAYRSVIAADIDNDGDNDIIAAGVGGNPVLLYRRNGSGFAPGELVPSGLTGAWSVQAADMDGDGDVDLLAASSDEDRVAIILNNGGGAFAHRVVTTATASVRGVVAADVDGDGRLDVVTASVADDSVSWFRARPRGDFDGDGDTDGNDLLVWQRTLGQTNVTPGSGADGDANGTINALDLAVWRGGYGATASAAAAPASAPAATPTGASGAAFAGSGTVSGLAWSGLFDAADELPEAGVAELAPTETRAADVAATDAALASVAEGWPVRARLAGEALGESSDDVEGGGLELELALIASDFR